MRREIITWSVAAGLVAMASRYVLVITVYLFTVDSCDRMPRVKRPTNRTELIP